MWDFICDYIFPVLLLILIILSILTIGIALLYFGINNEKYITKTITIQTEDDICNCIRNNAKEE